jgi:hypothetical protein
MRDSGGGEFFNIEAHMFQNNYAITLGSRFMVIGSSILLLAAGAAGQGLSTDELPPDALAEMQSAWTLRRDRVKSLDLDFTIERPTPGSGVTPKASIDPYGPFSNPQPKDDLLTTIDCHYVFAAGSKAMVRRSDKILDPNNPERLVTKVTRHVFDGTANYFLIEQGNAKLPMGSIDVARAASRDFVANVGYTPIGLWLDPIELLAHLGQSLKNASIEEKTVTVNGREYRRVTIAHSGSPDAVSAIDVDPKQQWAPVQYLTWYKGNPRTSLFLSYTQQDGHPVLQEWRYVRHDQEGGVESIEVGKVTTFQINGDIDKNRFAIEFPIGTHIVKTDGKKRLYFIQRSDGMQPLKKKDYGRITPDPDDPSESQQT